MSNKVDIGDLENFLPIWISDHLGEKSYMANEVTRLPSSHKEDSPSLDVRPSADVFPPTEKETNTMSQCDMDCLRESYSFQTSFRIRLPEANETIAPTH